MHSKLLIAIGAVSLNVGFLGPRLCGQEFPKMDDRWTVMVNGQTVPVNPDGSFTIPNVSAPDEFGSGGPGTAPDFISDDFLRVIGVGNVDGVTLYAYSELFQFQQGQPLSIGQMTISESPPPFPQSIRIESPTRVVELGQVLGLTVLGTLLDGSDLDVTSRESGTTYRTSNPDFATVAENGVVSGHQVGAVLITALNEGGAATIRINVTSETVSTTVEGFVEQDFDPVQGASVNVIGFPEYEGSTDSEGFFSLENVELPTEFSAITVVARTAGFEGRSEPLPPEDGGITDAGVIGLVPAEGYGIRYVLGLDQASLADKLDSTPTPPLDPGEFSDAGSGVVLQRDFAAIGVNAEGTLAFGGFGLRYDPAGGRSYGADMIWQGTIRDVWGTRFDSDGQTFFAYGGSEDVPNDGNATILSFGVFEDANLSYARSVTVFGPLQVQTTSALRQRDEVVFVDVELTNVGASPIEGLLFSRSTDIDINLTFDNNFDVFASAEGATLIGAWNTGRQYMALGTGGVFSVADGITFADINPTVFRNRDPEGMLGDYSTSFVFAIDEIPPGESVRVGDGVTELFSGWGSIAGEIADRGEPVSGAMVILASSRADGPSVVERRTVTDSHGRFRFLGVPVRELMTVRGALGTSHEAFGSFMLQEHGEALEVPMEQRRALRSRPSPQR